MSEDRPQGSHYEDDPGAPGREQAHPGRGQAPPGGDRTGDGRLRDQMAFDPRWKSPGRAALLSVIPGGGQLYIGYYRRGFAIAGTMMLFFALANSLRGALEVVGVLGTMFTWFFGIIDAGRMAALYNHAAAGRQTLEFPEDLRLPGIGGSVVAGVLLVVFGAIALSNTLFGYSLRWLDEWWPVFPLALGVYLLVRGVLDQVNRRGAARPGPEPAGATEREQESRGSVTAR